MTIAARRTVRFARRQRRISMLLVGTATALAILVAVLIATSASSRRADEIAFSGQVAACERGNIVRAYLIADALANRREPVARAKRAAGLFPILDCERTTEAGRPVPLSRPAQLAYIRRTIPPLPPR